MKQISAILLSVISILVLNSCGGSDDAGQETSTADTLKTDTSASTTTPEPEKVTPTLAPEARTKPVDYNPLMTEYHDMVCHMAKNRQEGKPINVDETLRLAELKKQLSAIGDNLSGEEKTKFNFALARANNLQSCP